jgi:hypothetical protein
MRSNAKLLVVSAAIWLSACVHPPQKGSSTEETTAITPTGLIATAEAKRGQTATLVGYLTWRTDTRALWVDRSAYLDAQQERRGRDYDYWAKCVTVYPASDARQLSDRRVRITGRVAIVPEDDIRSGWTCNAVALEDATITAE